MISDVRELAASLRCMETWTDLLEGMRRTATESDVALLPTLSEAPLAEVRRVLAEARPFVDTLAAEAAPPPPRKSRLTPSTLTPPESGAGGPAPPELRAGDPGAEVTPPM